MIVFEINTPMKTQDDFYVKLKGFVETSAEISKDDIQSAVTKSCTNYLKTLPLMSALDLVNADEAAKLIPGLGEVSSNVTKLEISTVDAVEHTPTSDIDVDIDPELETQKQKQGFFGRLKGLFRG